MIKNKFLVITIIVAILSVLIVPSTSKASVAFEAIDSDYDYYNVPNFPTSASENHRDFIVIEDNYFLLYKNYVSDFLAYSKSDTGFDIFISSGGGIRDLNTFVYECPVDDISSGWSLRKRYNSMISGGYSFSFTTNSKLIYASEDVKYLANTSSVFFPQTPTSMGVKLGQPMQVADLLKMTNKLMTIITPIGLVIFSTVLVIFLLKSKKWRRF